ncbi:MAG: hypothetical protein AAF982_11735, partial [Pseudomonadota bacterium]
MAHGDAGGAGASQTISFTTSRFGEARLMAVLKQADGGSFGSPNVPDDVHREGLAIEVDFSFPSER